MKYKPSGDEIYMAKKPLKFFFALFCGKMTIKILKLLKKNATNFPGSVVLTLCPDFLKYLQAPEKIIAITGTNGKTTVSNMILDILTDNGYDCTNNNFGGNVDTGITSALLKDSTFSGKPTKKYCVLEIDERSAVKIYPYIHPDFLVCTNLTRDSYKRNAHVEFIFNILDKNIPDKTHLILNGDDMISSRLKSDNQRTYFGMEAFDDERLVPDNIIKDITLCPECGSHLQYSFLRYNHIGRAYCNECSCKSPDIDFDAVSREFTPDGHALLTLKTPYGDEEYTVPSDNTIGLYNATAVIAALRSFGLSYEQVKQSFVKINIVKSRLNQIEKDGKKIISLLSKGQNPVACSHSCNIIRNTSEKKAIVLLLDDYFDARNTSENMAWIYDIDFEFLNDDNIIKIVVGGKRSDDYMLRLLIAGIPKEKIVCCEHEEDTADLIDMNEIDTAYILFDMYNDAAKNITEEKLKEKI